MKLRRSPGLTLIELVITLAVLAVLGTLALPTLGARLDQQRLNTAAEMLVADINEARFEAARQGRDMHVLLNPGSPWCWAVATHASCPCGQAQACELHSARAGDHAGVQLVQGHSLRLQANGQAGASGSAMLESRGGAQLRVELQALGRARICAAKGPTTRYPAC
jgi:prepilin-type N-terminal cleavage/methylation domain-containing protein